MANLLDRFFETYHMHVLAIKDRDKFVNALARQITLNVHDNTTAYLVETWVSRHVKAKDRARVAGEIFSKLNLVISEQLRAEIITELTKK